MLRFDTDSSVQVPPSHHHRPTTHRPPARLPARLLLPAAFACGLRHLPAPPPPHTAAAALRCSSVRALGAHRGIAHRPCFFYCGVWRQADGFSASWAVVAQTSSSPTVPHAINAFSLALWDNDLLCVIIPWLWDNDLLCVIVLSKIGPGHCRTIAGSDRTGRAGCTDCSARGMCGLNRAR